METALLGLGLSDVINRLKEMLIRQGFEVHIINSKPVIVAYREGSWFRRPKQLVLEISSMENNVTRIDITAMLSGKSDQRHLEEEMAENFATNIYQNFKTVVHAHGI